jgi:hypothetical protein
MGRSDALLRVCYLGITPPGLKIYLLTRPRDRQNASIRVVAEGRPDSDV